jgi:hypothetical protein
MVEDERFLGLGGFFIQVFQDFLYKNFKIYGC